MTRSAKTSPPAPARTVWLTLVALAALLWAYSDTLLGLSREWTNDRDSSIGALVPFVVAFLCWRSRQDLARLPLRPAPWMLLGVAGAELVRYYGLTFLYESLERYAFILALVCACSALFGLAPLLRLRWVVLILFLMVPLPGAVKNLISQPLQSASTSCTVWLLEAVGPQISREGNVLVLADGARVGIAEACNGLRMLISFVVVAAVFAALVNRPRWERVTLVTSSILIAFFCNMIRLSVTVGMFWVAESKVAEVFVHDFAGILMMPLAVGLLAGELWLLDRIFVSPAAPAPPPHVRTQSRSRGSRRIITGRVSSGV
ncbi:MAG: exosortase/archaeosortase family protein [Myxococcales bacterium]|nr:exosortase/archaeosortase family protein [Myxococcales bacterium]